MFGFELSAAWSAANCAKSRAKHIEIARPGDFTLVWELVMTTTFHVTRSVDVRTNAARSARLLGRPFDRPQVDVRLHVREFLRLNLIRGKNGNASIVFWRNESHFMYTQSDC